MKKSVLLFCSVLFALISFASIVEVPKFQGTYVNDYGSLLNDIEEQSINHMLRSYEDTTSTQLIVLTIPTHGDETLFDFSMKVFRSWKVGQQSKNNGVLLVITSSLNSVNTPGIRIVTGYGVEGSLPDVVCKRIIRSSRPLINDGHYYEGINLILSEIIPNIDKEFASDDKSKAKDLPSWTVYLIGFIVLLVVVIIVLVLMSVSKNEDNSLSEDIGGSGTNDNSRRSRSSNRSRDRDDDDNNRNIFIASSYSSSNDSYGGSDSGGSDSGCDCGGGDSGGGGGGD